MEMPRRKRVARWLLRGLLILLLAGNLALALFQSRVGTEAIAGLPWALVEVTGGSMEPVLEAGDAILVYQAPYYELEPGDIIVFSRDGELIVHEIVGRDGEDLITQGAANESPDAPVSREEYRARLVLRIPLLGGVWAVSRRPVGFVIYALLLSALLFGREIFSALYTALFERNTQ